MTLRPKPRWADVGVTLTCGHTVWGTDAYEDDYEMWQVLNRYQAGMWCQRCAAGYEVAGFWRLRG